MDEKCVCPKCGNETFVAGTTGFRCAKCYKMFQTVGDLPTIIEYEKALKNIKE